jgi:Ca-activated chloride channel family protein
MFRFYWPWLALLLPLPLLIRWLFPYRNREQQQLPHIYFPALDRLKQAFPAGASSSAQRRLWPLIFLGLAWISFVGALMQPEKVDQLHHENSVGYDLLLAVDTSASMQAMDMSAANQPISRLDMTKQVVKKFIAGRHGDRIALVIFGEKAYLHVPLTTDTQAVSRMLDTTVSGMAGNATAIGDAIGIAVKTLRERPEGSRVVILLTDGKDNASTIPPLEAAKLAKQYAIRIHTIGLGKKGSHGSFNGFSHPDLEIDIDLLREIAALTGGQFFLASDQRMLQTIYEEIDTLEKSEANQTTFLIREPLYRYPLLLAMIFMLMTTLCSLYSKKVAHGS